MRVFDRLPFDKSQIMRISRGFRIGLILLIATAMLAVTANFYMADEVFVKSTTLPVYIFFFLIMFIVGMFIEYASLWCRRGKNFYCTSTVIHGLAFLLVTYETGVFYSAGRDVYAHPPSYSLTSALSHMVTERPHTAGSQI